MFECLSCGDPLLGVVYKDFAQQIEEKSIEVGRLRDDVFQTLHATHKLPGLAWCVGHWVCQMAVLEEPSRRVPVSSLGETLDFADKGAVDRIARHSLKTLSATADTTDIAETSYLHHAKMLATVMSLKQCVASPALDEDAAERPEVNWVRPS